MEPVPTRVWSRPVIDPINTLAWLTMDAFWLCRLAWPAYIAAGLAAATAIILLYLGRRAGRGTVFADLGLSCWLAMNTIWLVHDLNGRETPWEVAAVLGLLGAGFVVGAARHGQDVCRVRVRPRRTAGEPRPTAEPGTAPDPAASE